MTLDELLQIAVQKGASDLHLKAGIVPVIRKNGDLRPLAAELPALSAQEIANMALMVMDVASKEHFEKFHEVDLGYGISKLGRFRVNIFRQRGSVRMVVRIVPYRVPQLSDLALPDIVQEIADIERGLILLTGATGSGKSTTMAAIIDRINQTKRKHILTIEDPIEYLIRDRRSMISQRELGVDTTSFAKALRAALRQDPDVIFIGEMRDRETIDIALEAAETGHLVLSTLHTLDASETVNRILSVYEPFQQSQVRRQLAAVLRACISQRLARKKDQTGFIPAVEIMLSTARIRELIESPERTRELSRAISESQSDKMQTFDKHLYALVRRGHISYEEGLRLSTNPEDFALKCSGVQSADQGWGNKETASSIAIEDEWNKIKSVKFEIEGPSSYKRDHERPVSHKPKSATPVEEKTQIISSKRRRNG